MKKRPPTTKPKSVRVAKKKRGISRVQALVLVLILAVIGVVAVALTRASGTPNYQYSWSKYCVAAYGSTSASEVKKCKQTSAEAIVYRLYRGMYNKSPDDGGYKFWTQKFAGDRIKVSDSDLTVSGTAKMGSDTAFVKSVYRNMLLREASDREMTSWRDKLKQGKLTRAQLITQFAVSSEAIKKNEDRWTAFVSRAPRVEVVQTAAQNQRKRFDAMYNDYQQPAKADAEAAAAALNNAKANLSQATKLADKNPPTADDLKAIAAAQAAAGRSYAAAQSHASAAAAKEAAAKRLYDRAKAVGDFSTDIKDNTVYGMNKIGDRYRATKQYSISAASYASSAKARVNEIAGRYSVAKKKYDAEVARRAKEEEAKRAALLKALQAAKTQQEKDKLEEQWRNLAAYGQNVANCSSMNYTKRVGRQLVRVSNAWTNVYRDYTYTPKTGGCKEAVSADYTGNPRQANVVYY